MPLIRSSPVRLASLIALAAVTLAPACAQAATTWHVTTPGDPASGASCPSAHSCSLREAIKDAVGGDTIVVPAFHIHLNSPLSINQSITVLGAGAAKTILDGGGAHRVISVIGPPPSFPISDASLTLRNLTVTGGSVTKNNAAQFAGGAGIQNNSNGTLHLVGVTVTNNKFTATGTTSQLVGGAGILSFSTVDASTSAISHNTLSIAGASGLDGGGGILVLGGDLILAQSTVLANTASITEGSSSEGNGGGGMMLGNQGGDDVILESATIAQNKVHIHNGTSIGDGGGGLLQTGSVSILSWGSTFSGNVADLTHDTAPGGGGAVLDAGSGSAYTNTTFAGNFVRTTAPATQQGGGAIFYGLAEISSLANDTFARNSPGGGTGVSIYDAGTRVVVKNSMFATGASLAANCAQDPTTPGTIASDGYNLYLDHANTCTLTGAGDHLSSHPGLLALADNGGPVKTIGLLTNPSVFFRSQAINAGDPHGCTDAFGQPLRTDARGVARPQPANGRCDIGAYESAPGLAYTALPGGVGHGSATLQGTAVNPDAVRATTRFQYGNTTSYGKMTPARAVHAFSTRQVQAVLSRLAPGRYHYRLVVTNPDGTSHGADRTFVIP
ncbi:MAG: choice-of-anchor Q domain-containing protein [Solirubrobacteraceae bacterium]